MPLKPETQELILEAPALVTLAAAGNRKKLREAKAAAMKLFHTETFIAPRKLRHQFIRAEPFFEETLNRLDAALPEDAETRREIITMWLRDIMDHAGTLPHRERMAWKDILVKFGMYVSRSGENMIEEFFAPITEMFLKKKDGSRWQLLFAF